MDPKKHPLVIVEELIKSIHPLTDGMYCLHVHNCELDICRCNLVQKDCPIIARICSFDINNGLTREMWDRIEARIRILIKQGVLEW